MDEDSLALPPAGDALAATLARGKKRRQWRHTPTASFLFPRPRPTAARASWPMCQPPASAATSGASHASTPTAAHGGPHTTGSPSSTPPATYASSSETAHAASHDLAWAVPRERHPRTSATLNYSRFQ